MVDPGSISGNTYTLLSTARSKPSAPLCLGVLPTPGKRCLRYKVENEKNMVYGRCQVPKKMLKTSGIDINFYIGDPIAIR